MSIKIALVGNPNSGKTTMFNALTGSTQYVGNWPGVTVEKKEGKLKGQSDVVVTDLPGIYSLSPYTPEEIVTRNYLLNEKPDVIINIIDASNIERNLYLTTQLLETGIPVVLALNMMDIVRKNGDEIKKTILSKMLGCDVVETTALKGQGAEAAAQKAIEVAKCGKGSFAPAIFSEEVQNTLNIIKETVSELEIAKPQLQFYAVKLFERDKDVYIKLALSNDALAKIEQTILQSEKQNDDDSESIITNERYFFIDKVVSKSVHKKNKGKLTASDKIDLVVTNRFLALPIFALIMFLIYYVSVSTIGTWATDWVNDVLFGEIINNSVSNMLQKASVEPWLESLVVDGIIGGVGAVLGFLPQMTVLFLLLTLLEDCGYMARIAFIMDKIFSRFGLSGKSFIPILIGTGCSVPGIMASRTIENEADRKMTVITTSFIPCSAKLPIIALISGVLFKGSVFVAPSAYFAGMLAIAASGIILKKSKGFADTPSPFVMELPAYHLPNPKNVLKHVLDRVKSFVKKAGTVIFVACAIIWFLSNYDFGLNMVDTSQSMLASLGTAISFVFAPLGFNDWRAAVATLTGLVAKENVVGTLGVLYGASGVSADSWVGLSQTFNSISGYSFLIFNLLCAPCVAAIGAISREMGNAKWTLIAVGYQTAVAYVASLMIYQFGRFFVEGYFGIFTAVAVVALIYIVYLLLRKRKTELV